MDPGPGKAQPVERTFEKTKRKAWIKEETEKTNSNQVYRRCKKKKGWWRVKAGDDVRIISKLEFRTYTPSYGGGVYAGRNATITIRRF